MQLDLIEEEHENLIDQRGDKIYVTPCKMLECPGYNLTSGYTEYVFTSLDHPDWQFRIPLAPGLVQQLGNDVVVIAYYRFKRTFIGKEKHYVDAIAVMGMNRQIHRPSHYSFWARHRWSGPGSWQTYGRLMLGLFPALGFGWIGYEWLGHSATLEQRLEAMGKVLISTSPIYIFLLAMLFLQQPKVTPTDRQKRMLVDIIHEQMAQLPSFVHFFNRPSTQPTSKI